MLKTLGYRDYDALPARLKGFLDEQHYKAYKLIDHLRYAPTGMYRDAYVFEGQEDIPCSVAANGVGLIGLAIAHHAGWDSAAPAKALTTLRTMAHRHAQCRPERDKATGFFRHWFDVATGRQRMNAEFSTVDTAIFICGAIFASNYFQDPEMVHLTRQLLHSIDWSAAIADEVSGILYMSVEEGKGAEPICPFNEYALLAYIIAQVHPERAQLWHNAFQDTKLYKHPTYLRYGKTIPGMPHGIPSSFVYQFPFYLVYDYTVSGYYREIMYNVALADKASWREQGWPSFVWGHGAGENHQGYYHADAIDNNPTGTVSPYIAAGFLPVYPEAAFDLIKMYTYIQAHGESQSPRFRHAYRFGLSRFCPGHRWYPRHLAAIDWSSMLYGLTAFKWGTHFFSRHNQITGAFLD